MFNYHPAIKIVAVFLVCLLLAYLNYLLFESFDFTSDVNRSYLIKAGVVPYLFVVLLFCDFYWRHRLYLVFSTWLVFNLAICINCYMHVNGPTPPLYLQYAQSTSLVILTVLLLFTNLKYPNWLRIFSLVNLLVLIPCLTFYFLEWWTPYKIFVYLLCFTPMIKSLIFFRDQMTQRPEVLDGD